MRLKRLSYWASSLGRWRQWQRFAKKTVRKKSNWPGVRIPEPYR